MSGLVDKKKESEGGVRKKIRSAEVGQENRGNPDRDLDPNQGELSTKQYPALLAIPGGKKRRTLSMSMPLRASFFSHSFFFHFEPLSISYSYSKRRYSVHSVP
ncbi:hypothetical protein RRG08_003622 [Elysia crispata]|uniref:Uncharacterized protein n=1 Tax=Elysia crispata TaxID=231223 RepID=A0AAE1AUV9_9GAST|nr:hypothetical protein RRG08_003622 [Elysia crispata]